MSPTTAVKKMNNIKFITIISLLLCLGLLILSSTALAQTPVLPSITLGVDQADSPEKVSTLLQVLFLLTVLSLAPAIVVMMTSFTRYAIVLSLVRHALGTQQMPPNQIIVGLALLLTFFTMAPVFNQINDEALKPYLAEEITQKEALDKALKPIRTFMLRQTSEKDLNLFKNISKIDKPKTPDDLPTIVILSSFITSELKTAFSIGFRIYIPFLVIDMVVASVLLSMGMMMLPPFMISLPFKLMLFVLIDGWNILIGSLVKSFM